MVHRLNKVVIALQEILLSVEKIFVMGECEVYREKRSGGGGGTALLMKKKLKHHPPISNKYKLR